jgi:hypothetical protein
MGLLKLSMDFKLSKGKNEKTKLSTISLIIHFSMLEHFQPHFLSI